MWLPPNATRGCRAISGGNPMSCSVDERLEEAGGAACTGTHASIALEYRRQARIPPDRIIRRPTISNEE
jgi:hypothetical protein